LHIFIKIAIFLYLAFLSLVTIQAEPSLNLTGRLDIAGGTAHLPIIEIAAKKFMLRHPKTIISVTGGGSGVGLKKLSLGLADIANTGRSISAAEMKKYKVETQILAIDAIVIGVHKKSPLKKLSSDEIRQIFSLQPSKQILTATKLRNLRPLIREYSSGTRQVFRSYFTKAMELAPQLTLARQIVTSNAAMVRSISLDPKGIGYFSFGFLNPKVKAIAIDGIYPTKENICSDKYKLKRKLYMHINKDSKNKLVKAFIDYLQEKEMHTTIESLGFLPNTETKSP